MVVRRRVSAGALIVLLGTLHIAAAYARDKTDVVTLRNGDRITGEIKNLQYGLLQVSTDSMSTIDIQWSSVASVHSAMSFDIELIGGRRHYGSIETSPEGDLLVSNGEREATTLAMSDITRIAELESGFLARVNGSMSVGLNYTKSSGISVANLNVSSGYRGAKVNATLDISANRTSSPDAETTDQETIASSVQFLRPRPSFWVMLATLQSNEALGIERRLQGGAALARYLRQTQNSEITGFAGVVVNYERATGEDEDRQSLEGVIGAQWRIYRFSDPEVSLSSAAALYPSLTESGRYRGNLNITLRREIVNDLFFDLSLYESYDSDPPDVDAARRDYGIVTSMGYSF